MAILSTSQLAFGFGILGNVVSFLVYLSPIPTFYRIWKKKSTQGFQSIPYSVALFSAMLYLYYAYLKENGILLITINSFGTAIEIVYLTIFLVYATKEAKIYTTKLFLLFNIGAFGAIVIVTYLFVNKEGLRVQIVGWICAIFSVSVFAAPLSIMRRVIKTRSVEYMPFLLSFFLTICAVMWFFYGLLIHDMYIAAPNILGFSFGIAQMILYAIFKNRKQQILPDSQSSDVDNNNKLQDLEIVAIDIKTIVEMQENNSDPIKLEVVDDDGDDEKKNQMQLEVALTTSNA